jgi:hypothetical protein
MHDLTLWLTPFALLPAVALLAYSTATRYGRLRGQGAEPDPSNVRRRALLRTSLVGLCASLVLLAAALLVGVAFSYANRGSALAMLLLTSSGIFALILATAQLMREALLDRRLARGEQA